MYGSPTALPPATEALKSAWCWSRASPAARLARRWRRWSGPIPQRQLDDALRRFKQLVETGEVIRSEASPDGTDAKQQRSQRPAEPLAADQ